MKGGNAFRRLLFARDEVERGLFMIGDDTDLADSARSPPYLAASSPPGFAYQEDLKTGTMVFYRQRNLHNPALATSEK
jgi:hypothetical protein